MTQLKFVTGLLLALGVAAGAGLFWQRAVAKPAEAVAEDVPARGKDAAKPPQEYAALAKRVWTITDLVLEGHTEPPTRPAMLGAALKGLLKAAETKPPEGLDDRLASVKSVEQFAALLADLWPKAGDRGNLEELLVKALLASVPGEADLIAPDVARVLEQVAANRYVGIGVQIRLHPEDNIPQFIDVFGRGSARKGGVRTNDLLLEVDGKGVASQPLNKVVEWLRGEEGSSLTIKVRQPGEKEERTLKLTRAVVPFDGVVGYRRVSDEAWDYRLDAENKVGYVWVNSIRSSTVHELRKAEERLRADGARALVLDLRFSHGEGQLHHAALLADALLDGGLMWGVRGADKKVREYRADRECLFRGLPMVVLINTSADRPQVAVAAALRDNGRAAVVGSPTKLDGQVKSQFSLPDGQGALILRTGTLVRAAEGKDWPLMLDHHVDITVEQQEPLANWFLDKRKSEMPAGKKDDPPPDPQLTRALEVVREALKADAKKP